MFIDNVFNTEHEEREGMESIAKSLDFGGVTHYHEGEESDGASSSKGQGYRSCQVKVKGYRSYKMKVEDIRSSKGQRLQVSSSLGQRLQLSSSIAFFLAVFLRLTNQHFQKK